MPSAAPSASTACCSFDVMSWLVSAVVMSVASSRRSMTRVTAVAPRCCASALTRCAVLSASILVEDGSDVPPLTTTRLNVSLICLPQELYSFDGTDQWNLEGKGKENNVLLQSPYSERMVVAASFAH